MNNFNIDQQQAKLASERNEPILGPSDEQQVQEIETESIMAMMGNEKERERERETQEINNFHSAVSINLKTLNEYIISPDAENNKFKKIMNESNILENIPFTINNREVKITDQEAAMHPKVILKETEGNILPNNEKTLLINAKGLEKGSLINLSNGCTRFGSILRMEGCVRNFYL